MRPSPKLIDVGIDFKVRLKFYQRAHKIALFAFAFAIRTEDLI
jgi:hypothetical protein